MDDPRALAGLEAHFDHVAVGGPTIEALLPLWAGVLGGRPGGGGRNTALGFRTLQLHYPEGRKVELIAPDEGSTFLDSFLARSGGRGGLHHVTFLVPSVTLALAVLHGRGYETFGERPDDPAWAEAFVHPRDAGGVLLQIATPGEASDWGEQWEPNA